MALCPQCLADLQAADFGVGEPQEQQRPRCDRHVPIRVARPRRRRLSISKFGADCCRHRAAQEDADPVDERAVVVLVVEEPGGGGEAGVQRAGERPLAHGWAGELLGLVRRAVVGRVVAGHGGRVLGALRLADRGGGRHAVDDLRGDRQRLLAGVHVDLLVDLPRLTRLAGLGGVHRGVHLQRSQDIEGRPVGDHARAFGRRRQGRGDQAGGAHHQQREQVRARSHATSRALLVWLRGSRASSRPRWPATRSPRGGRCAPTPMPARSRRKSSTSTPEDRPPAPGSLQGRAPRRPVAARARNGVRPGRRGGRWPSARPPPRRCASGGRTAATRRRAARCRRRRPSGTRRAHTPRVPAPAPRWARRARSRRPGW